MTNDISFLPILLYIGAIFWTLGYDTIYGVQDISDDEVIGVKSTAIKFKDKIGLFVGCCYLFSIIAIVLVMANLKINYSSILLIFFIITLFYQIKICDAKSPSACLKAFKLNNLSGFFVFLTLYLTTLNN